MPVFEVRGPDGKTYRVTAPEGATAEEAIAYVQRELVNKAPSDWAVAVNALLKGVAGVPDAVLNTPTNVWNLGKAAYGTAVTAAGRPDLAPGITPTPDVARRALQAAGLIRADAEPTNSGQRILDATLQGVGGAVLFPASGWRGVLANGVLGGTGGFSAGVAGEASDHNPLAMLAAGVLAPGAASKAGQIGVRGARLAREGQAGRTGRVLATAAGEDPAALARRIRAGNVEIIPGAPPTTWQAAMSPGLSQLKRSSQGAGADYSAVEGAQNAARLAALKGIQPGAAGLTSAEARNNAGKVLAENYAFQRGALKEAEGGAWNHPALDQVSFTLPAARLQGIVEKYYPGATFQNAPPLLRQLVSAAAEGGAVPHAEAQKWRSQLGSLAQDKINTDAPARAVALEAKGAIDDLYRSAAEAGAQKFAVTGQGPFGPVYGNLAGDSENAIAHLLAVGKGEVPGAAVNQMAGPVGFVAGKPVTKGPGAYGLLHIDAKGRDDVLRALPEISRDGTPYSRLQQTKKGELKPKGGKPDWFFLGDGEYEALLRNDFNFSPKDHWAHTAYKVDADKKLPVGSSQLSRVTASAPPTQTLAGTTGTSSIDDVLGQMLSEASAFRNPEPVQVLRDPRAYSTGLMPPDASDAFNAANFLTRTRKQRFETGPARALNQVGADGLPQKQGAEAFDLFYNARNSQAQDIAALGRAFPGNDDVWNAMRQAAMADLIEKSKTAGGLLSERGITNHTKARSEALRGLLSDEQMGQLQAVKDDLRRATAAEDLNRMKGSDTMQKLMGAGLLENPWVTRSVGLMGKAGPAALDWVKHAIRAQQARRVSEALIDPDPALSALSAYGRITAPTSFDGATLPVAVPLAGFSVPVPNNIPYLLTLPGLLAPER